MMLISAIIIFSSVFAGNVFADAYVFEIIEEDSIVLSNKTIENCYTKIEIYKNMEVIYSRDHYPLEKVLLQLFNVWRGISVSFEME